MINSTQKKSIVGLKELRLNLEKYILRTKKGESFTVVRRSEPIFTLSPVDDDNASMWETVVDFTKIKKGGIPADDLIASLKRLNA